MKRDGKYVQSHADGDLKNFYNAGNEICGIACEPR